MRVIIIIIIVIIIIIIHLYADYYNYMPKTNHVSWVYEVSANLWLQFMTHLLLFPMVQCPV